MKRFLFGFIGFLLWFLSGAIAAGLIAQLHPKLEHMLFAKGSQFGHTVFRATDFAGQSGSPEILTLGSSTCYRGIDVRPFDAAAITTFNLCSSSQSFFNSEFLLHWAIHINLTPRYVLMDVYPQMWQSSGLESTRDFIVNNDLAHHVEFQRMAWASLDIQTILLATYFGVTRLFSSNDHLTGTNDPYIQGGFTYSLNAPVDSVECMPDTCELNRKQRRAFERIRQTCEEEGIQLLLVNPPQLCEEVFEKPKVMEGLPWIECNDWPLAKVDSLYYDDHHLRGVGAELYSEWLAGQVLALMD
jgi:hypothetical protein